MKLGTLYFHSFFDGFSAFAKEENFFSLEISTVTNNPLFLVLLFLLLLNYPSIYALLTTMIYLEVLFLRSLMIQQSFVSVRFQDYVGEYLVEGSAVVLPDLSVLPEVQPQALANDAFLFTWERKTRAWRSQQLR